MGAAEGAGGKGCGRGSGRGQRKGQWEWALEGRGVISGVGACPAPFARAVNNVESVDLRIADVPRLPPRHPPPFFYAHCCAPWAWWHALVCSATLGRGGAEEAGAEGMAPGGNQAGRAREERKATMEEAITEAGSGARQASSQAGRQAAKGEKGGREEEMDGERGRKGSGGWVSRFFGKKCRML